MGRLIGLIIKGILFGIIAFFVISLFSGGNKR